MRRYKWQGEFVEVEFGHFHALPDTDRPLAWYNFEIEREPNMSKDGSLSMPAIRFKYDGHEHIIANHFGIGAHKLRKGGWPNIQHFSFGKGSFYPGDDFFTCKALHEKEFAEHEAERERWMRRTDPAGYARIVELRNAAKKLYA